jgi:hypothetical protein
MIEKVAIIVVTIVILIAVIPFVTFLTMKWGRLGLHQANQFIRANNKKKETVTKQE